MRLATRKRPEDEADYERPSQSHANSFPLDQLLRRYGWQIVQRMGGEAVWRLGAERLTWSEALLRLPEDEVATARAGW